MKTKKNHIDIPITQVLACTDDALQSIFGGVVSEIRDQLLIRINNGELPWS